MKKITLLSGLALTFALTSCDKLKNEIAKNVDPFNFSQQTVEVTVEPISTTAVFVTSGIDTVDINLDQIIKENTPEDLKLSSSNIQSLTLEKITIELMDHDADNYLANFEEVKAHMNSDAGITAGKNDIVATAVANDVAYDANNQKLVINGDPKMELVDYLKGSKVYYHVQAKARRATTKDLRMKMTIDYKLVPKL